MDGAPLTVHGSPGPNAGAQRRPVYGGILLGVAALIWGIGFYAQRVSIDGLPPLTATALRLALAMPIVLVALPFRARRGRLPWAIGLVLGSLLYAVYALQAVAMLHTPVSRVALIAGLYVVLTPILQPVLGLGRPMPLQLIAALVACVATALLCGVLGDPRALASPPNVGDALMLGTAVISAIYVLLVGRFGSDHDPIALNAVQILAMTVWSVIGAVTFDRMPPLSVMGPIVWGSLAYLAVFSTILAFLLQLLGQRELSPTSASTIMVLETPIGVFAAVMLLGETMVSEQWMGAALALLAVGLSLVCELRPRNG